MTQNILQWCWEWGMHGSFMSKSLKDIINTPNFEISQKVNIFNTEVHEYQSHFLESLCFYTLQNTLTALFIFHRPVTVRVMYHTAAHTFYSCYIRLIHL
jgi:hypothetical protein